MYEKLYLHRFSEDFSTFEVKNYEFFVSNYCFYKLTLYESIKLSFNLTPHLPSKGESLYMER